MAYIFNSASEFSDESLEGFIEIHSDIIRRVHGGVARAQKTPRGQVAIVTGGGSGHYPAFGGLVGPGLAHGAAMGNVFASPSALQIYSVAKAVENGGGVLLTYGNYAGDVLNFTQAQERLRSEGIDCQTVAVTDDISSASLEEIRKRRGIAGDLAVFKIAAAAAESGASLDEVVELASRANHLTRSFGVAFGGCTLPGAIEPLFTVPEGRMGLGMGIHGEPGIGETEMMAATPMAALMWEQLMAEKPEGAGESVIVLVNGLGSVKHEELFLLYREFSLLAARDGIAIRDREVGELVTSFEMAGVSLTLFWADERLESLWAEPAYTPAYRRGSVIASGERAEDEADEDETLVVAESSEASREAAARVAGSLRVVAELIDTHAEELGRLDSIAGDGDHGIGMQRGARASAAATAAYLEAGAGVRDLLIGAGDAWADQAGGTSGALWGAILGALGRTLGNEEAPSGPSVSAAVTAASEAVQKFGGAQPGDKTMVDALVPFAEGLARRVEAGEPLLSAWTGAAEDAQAAAAATADMMPRMGRARPHAEKALGTPDPGATSLGLIVAAVGHHLNKEAK